MHAVLVAFELLPDAYAFVSEIRRRADTMLWEVRVRRTPSPVVVLPEHLWRGESFVRNVAERYGGVIREDDRVLERPR